MGSVVAPPFSYAHTCGNTGISVILLFMEDILHADIFFIVTTSVIVLISAVVVALLIYVLKIVRDAYHVAHRVREEADEIIDEVDDLREGVLKGGIIFNAALRRFMKSTHKRRKKDKIKKSKK
jgi:hypothetical protein